jgi:hypothetical protein
MNLLWLKVPSADEKRNRLIADSQSVKKNGFKEIYQMKF